MRKLKAATVDHAIHILASMLVEAMAKRKRGDAAQNQIDAIHALRQLYDEQRKAWRVELASLKARVSALEQAHRTTLKLTPDDAINADQS